MYMYMVNGLVFLKGKKHFVLIIIIFSNCLNFDKTFQGSKFSPVLIIIWSFTNSYFNI